MEAAGAVSAGHQESHFVFPSFTLQCADSREARDIASAVSSQRERYRQMDHVGSYLARKLGSPRFANLRGDPI